jgi:hypothetical protein
MSLTCLPVMMQNLPFAQHTNPGSFCFSAVVMRSFPEPHAHETKETEGSANAGAENEPINEKWDAVISADTENDRRTETDAISDDEEETYPNQPVNSGVMQLLLTFPEPTMFKEVFLFSGRAHSLFPVLVF